MAGKHTRSRSIGLAAAIVLMLGVTTTAFAATESSIAPRTSYGATVDVIGGVYNSKLMATVDVVIVCDEISYFDWETGESGTTTDGSLWADATLLQAQGRSIAVGSGGASRIPVTCDGATVNELSIAVVAETLPLKRGPALVGVRAEVTAPYMEGDYLWATSGPMEIRLGR